MGGKKWIVSLHYKVTLGRDPSNESLQPPPPPQTNLIVPLPDGFAAGKKAVEVKRGSHLAPEATFLNPRRRRTRKVVKEESTLVARTGWLFPQVARELKTVVVGKYIPRTSFSTNSLSGPNFDPFRRRGRCMFRSGQKNMIRIRPHPY